MFVFKHSHLSKFSCRLGPARLLRKVRVGTPFLVCRLMDALLLSSSLHFHSSNPRHDNVIRDARPLFFDFSILSISSLRLFSSSLKKRQTSNRQIVIVSTLVPTNFIISRFAVYAMSERRFSLAIEDVDTSESPESPINKPLSGFLVENHCPTLTKSSSFTSMPKDDQYTPKRRFSICDLNTFSEDVSGRFTDQSALPRSCNFKNHHRRNSVAIKFLMPRTADTSTTSEND